MKLMTRAALLLMYSLFCSPSATPPADSLLILIPGGWFSMGSLSGQKDERPVHQVYIDSFYLGISEVTIGEYFECVRSGTCEMPSFWNRPFF